jgi:major membrane immunogen (membrane-anchored lipoprotein)
VHKPSGEILPEPVGSGHPVAVPALLRPCSSLALTFRRSCSGNIPSPNRQILFRPFVKKKVYSFDFGCYGCNLILQYRVLLTNIQTMKKLFLFLISVAIVFGCTTEKPEGPTTKVGRFTPYWLSPEVMKGQVESVEQRAYWATEEEGKIIQGALIGSKERDSINWSDDFIVKFDSLGLPVKVKFLNGEGEVYGYFKIHSEEGRYVKSKWVNAKTDSVDSYSKHMYDDAGNMIKVEQYRAYVDTLINTFDAEHDERGRWTGGQWTQHDGEPGNTLSIVYNEAGLVTSWENTNPEGEVASAKMTYDENGWVILMEITERDGETTVVEEKYTEVDEKGNWLQMVSYEEGKIVGMDVRTIKYY